VDHLIKTKISFAYLWVFNNLLEVNYGNNIKVLVEEL